MKPSAVVIALAGITVVLAMAQQRNNPPDPPGYEIKCLFPREVSPARYEQVDQRELQAAADQGWELVSVTPYVYRNEERGGDSLRPKPVVTQTYPAYFSDESHPSAATNAS